MRRPDAAPRRMILVLLSALLIAAAAAREPGGERLSETDMLAFLVQCRSGNENGPPLPLPSGSPCRRPQTFATPVTWRKHDWPDRRIAGAEPLGHQASDAALDPRSPFPLVLQTFDFGDAGRTFGRLDRGKGDGGDALTILDGAAWIFFTEDGGGGQQWFIAEACRISAQPEAARASWLLFADDVARRAWRERLARLTIRPRPDDCPARFNDAFTRYLRDSVTVPFRVVGPGKPVFRTDHAVDTIVSEHFGGASIARADHLERFYLGRGLGKYRWERWENLAETSRGEAGRLAEELRQSGRCPELAYSAAPARDWVMVDCRTWTNLVQLTEPWTGSAFDWPGAAFDNYEGSAGRNPP